MSEKHLLPGPVPLEASKHHFLRRLLILLAGLCIVIFRLLPRPVSIINDATAHCSMPTFSAPSDLTLYFSTDEFRNTSIQRLSRAVTFPTMGYDDLRDPAVDGQREGEEGFDQRWNTFPPFHDFLTKTYPLVHQKARLEKIGGYSLLYTLEGSDSEAKPILFMGHQDVVLISSDEGWEYSPFSGYFDGEWIWGRGSSDCKSNVIGLLSVLEKLLEESFTPKRTILFAFGEDEETGGRYGSVRTAALLEERYGRHGIQMILDEGGGGLVDTYGPLMALPALAEKGYADLGLKCYGPGGHSSVPPGHTSIGLLSHFLSILEDTQVYKPRLSTQNPHYEYLQCVARHGDKDLVPKWLSSELASGNLEDLAEKLSEREGDTTRYLLQTSKAITVVLGGNKNNVLPVQAEARINSRIEITSSVEAHKAAMSIALLRVAKKYNVTFEAFSEVLHKGSKGPCQLSLLMNGNPSPITPSSVDGKVAPEWNTFTEAVRAAFGPETIVAPSLATSNTDTTHYWNVSKTIYRWTPARIGSRLNAHGTNERIRIQTHMEAARVYSELILRMDDLA